MTDGPNVLCTVCDCSWKEHMIMTYKSRQCEINIPRTASATADIETHLQNLETNIYKLQRDQDEIIDSSAKLTLFLERNSLWTQIDAFVDHFEYLIEYESVKTFGRSAIEGRMLQVEKQYQQTLKSYRDASSDSPITQADVPKLIEQLKGLGLVGNMIAEAAVFAESSKSNSQKLDEDRVVIARQEPSVKQKPQKSNK